METSVNSITPTSAVYEIGGRRFEVESRGFAEAIADAYSAHQRPRCMCRADGVEMYVARLAGASGGYIVKRMPDTGSRHAPVCPSYEPPAAFSGLGQVLGSAITEDPATGETTLKLDFPLAKMPGRLQVPPADGQSNSASSTGSKFSLRGLLHYLWDQAELTRWHPGFTGKRTWATVRRHLLSAAKHKLTGSGALCARLYVPEPFSVEARDAINSRRLVQWQHAAVVTRKSQPLMLLIGEVKEIVPARYGYKAVVKHVPDQGFMMNEQLYHRLGRRFEPELSLWGAAEGNHMVMIATFSVAADVPKVVNLSLMPVTQQWLPVEDEYEKQLLDKLISENRAFVKGLRYNLGRGNMLASAVLTDCEDPAPLLFIEPASVNDTPNGHKTGELDHPVWTWRRSGEPMPPLPARRARSPRPRGFAHA